jgi:hypothetical protein
MINARQSVFRLDDVAVPLANVVTYQDHLYRIEKALWPLIFAEVANAYANALSRDNAYEAGRAFSRQNLFLQKVAEATLDALEPLGYDRARMAGVVAEWLKECAVTALEGIQKPNLLGPRRFERPTF